MKASRLDAKKAVGALALGLALLARPCAAVPTFGNATYVSASNNPSYTTTLTLSANGSGTVLVVVIGQTGTSPGALTVKYNNLAMTEVGSTQNCGDGGFGYFQVYYQSNPANGQTLSLSGGTLGDSSSGGNYGNAYSLMYFSYSGVPSASSPIGNTSITSNYEINTSASGNSSASLAFTPQSASSTIVEYMPFADNCGNDSGTFALQSGATVRMNPAANTSYNIVGGAFGDIATGSTSSFNATVNYNNPGNSCFGAMAWCIELLGTAQSPTISPTISKTFTISPTPSRTFTALPTGSVTKTFSYTVSPTVTPTYTVTMTGTATNTVTKAPTVVIGASSTNTPSPTATFTPQLTSVYQGLNTAMRPYGLEYVPFPTVTSSSNQFYPLYMTFTATNGTSNATANTAWGAPCNTARWHIVFQNLSSVSSPLVANGIEVETRIGPYGVTCVTGVYDQNIYANATSLVLPSRPQNFSSAYFWVSTSSTANPLTGQGVPYTERFDAVGDPRFVPYADLLDGYTGAVNDGLQGGYNWFWRDFSNTGDTYQDVAQDAYYYPFLSHATNDHYRDQSGGGSVPSPYLGQNIDIPKLFALIRNGVMTSNGIYTAMTGYDSYYAGQGGEIGGDNDNDFAGGVPTFGGPWGSSSTSYHVDEIIGNYEANAGWDSSSNVAGAAYVVTGTSSTNIGWMSLPFVGELWPDGLYDSDWSSTAGNSTWGNLKNLQEGGVAYRMPMQNITNTSKPLYLETLHHQMTVGCASFMDGTNDGSTPFQHLQPNSPFMAGINLDGTELGTDYNYPLPTSFSVNRPWSLTGGTSPPEWSNAPYTTERTHMDVYSAISYTSGSWGFYADNNDGASSTTYKSAAAIRTIDVNNALSATASGQPAGGWFIVNGLLPSTQAGINMVAEFALLSCLRTFHDAGVPVSATCTVCSSFTSSSNTYSSTGKVYRIPPVPLVDILVPNNSTVESGNSTVTIEWNERYARWDGNQYDENYPCLDANVGACTSTDVSPSPTAEWHDSQPIGFNVIYNMPTGVSPTAWYSVVTGQEVVSGQANGFVPGAAGNYQGLAADDILPGSSYETSTSPHSHVYSLTWSNVAPNTYNIRVECFRLPSASSTSAYGHYSYHQVQINTTQ